MLLGEGASRSLLNRYLVGGEGAAGVGGLGEPNSANLPPPYIRLQLRRSQM